MRDIQLKEARLNGVFMGHSSLLRMVFPHCRRRTRRSGKRCGVTGDLLDQPILADLPGVRIYV